MADKAARRGARIICTQELFRSQYFCQSEDYANFRLAEGIPGPATEAFQKLAKRRGVVVIASLFERRASGLYHNTAAVIDADGSLLGIYRKMHIPDDPLYYEKFYFTPGDTGFCAWKTRFGKIGVLICWDQWYPEAARLTALQGAEIIFYPTAIGWHPGEKAKLGAQQHGAWETAQRAHSIANGCFVAVCNRVGHERPGGGAGIEFWGQSFVSARAGRFSAGPRRRTRRFWSSLWTWRTLTQPGRTGPSCATAGSTRTATCRSASATRSPMTPRPRRRQRSASECRRSGRGRRPSGSPGPTGAGPGPGTSARSRRVCRGRGAQSASARKCA